MAKRTKKRFINYTLKDCGFKKSDIFSKISFIDKEIYDFLMLNAPIDSNVKFKSKTIKESSKYFKKYKLFLSEIGLSINEYNELSKIKIDIKSNGIYTYHYFGFVTFFKFLRNAIAHGNIIKVKGKNIYVFYSLTKSPTRMEIDDILNCQLCFLMIVDNIDIIHTIIKKFELYNIIVSK